MKYRKLLVALLIGNLALGIIGCGNKDTSKIELEYAVPEYDMLEESTVQLLPWLQLSSLESHPELRAQFDEFFGITGTVGNKEGKLYYNVDTQKADQNVTLYMALKNENVNVFFSTETALEKLSDIAAEHYADVEADNLASAYATINAYFELLPDQEAGQFDGDATISRAQAMALLMRATTQVNENGAPEINADFTSAVGESQYTDFSAPMNEFAYINTNNGLTEGVFNSAMTRGEYICMVTNMLHSDYQALLKAEGYNDIFANTEVSITTVTDAGDISYADAIADASKGVPTDMYKTFETALRYGFLTEDAFEDWDESITKSEAVELFITMTSSYVHNTANGFYTGSSEAVVDADTADVIKVLEEQGYNNIDLDLIDYMLMGGVDPSDTAKLESFESGRFGESLPGDGTGAAKLSEWAKEQGADYIWGWTLIFENGKGAGENPSYGIYVRPGDSRYGQRFELGSTLPNGDVLTGNRAEKDALQSERAKEQFIEDGGQVIEDEETGKEIWIID